MRSTGCRSIRFSSFGPSTTPGFARSSHAFFRPSFSSVALSSWYVKSARFKARFDLSVEASVSSK